MNFTSKKRTAIIGAASLGAVVALALGGTAAMAHDGGSSRDGMRGPLSSLVTNGTITADDATAIREALQAQRDASKEAHQAEKAADVKAALAPLVTKGTITQAQADAIANHSRGDSAARNLTAEQRTAVRAALESVREADKSAHEAEMKADRAAAISGLVAKGTLTQTQADAVTKAFDAMPSGHAGKMGGGKDRKDGKMGHGHSGTRA